MLNKDTLVNVTNRSNSLVGYKIPEMHIKRRFGRNETKQLRVEEIRALAAEKGGRSLIKNNLIIENDELVNELIYNVQPEYYYTSTEVVELLLNGSEDQLLDALDFGPEGVQDLIKNKAVELKLNDVRKRDIILEKTGFNVTKAIEANILSEQVVEETKVRRAAPVAATNETAGTIQRRTAAPTPKYRTTVTNK